MERPEIVKHFLEHATELDRQELIITPTGFATVASYIRALETKIIDQQLKLGVALVCFDFDEKAQEVWVYSAGSSRIEVAGGEEFDILWEAEQERRKRVGE